MIVMMVHSVEEMVRTKNGSDESSFDMVKIKLLATWMVRTPL